MDWISWLSKATLEPSLVYEYGLAFAHNELEEEDIAYFNHEFLQSMGVSIAKHRLEILKLARKEKEGGGGGGSRRGAYPISRLLGAIKKTRRSLADYIRALVRREDRALVLVSRPSRSHSLRWKKAMMTRNRKIMAAASMKKEEKVMMLTNGPDHPLAVSTPKLHSFSSPLGFEARSQSGERSNDGGGYDDDEEEDVDVDVDVDGGFWSPPVVDDIRWDAMFQDLKPT